MPRTCSACSHPNRAAIDEALAANRGSIRGIARQHRLSPDAVERHAKSHLPQTLALAAVAVEESRADSLVDLLREAVGDARRLRGLAEDDGDYRAAIACVKTLTDIVETLARVAEKLAQTEKTKPPEPQPVLSDNELAGAIEGILRRAAARKETSDVIRPN